MAKTILDTIRTGIADRSLRIGKPELRSIRMYLNNSKRKLPRAPADNMAALLYEYGSWPLAEKFHTDSLPWLRAIVTTKSGEMRDTIQTRRFTPASLRILADVREIWFAGMTAKDMYYGSKPEYASGQFYPVFEAYDSQENMVRFYYLPWQASYIGGNAGLFPVTEEDVWLG